MGIGPLNIERPFTSGDSGWFGVERPLVGAANGVKSKVSTQSAGQVAVSVATPERLENLREQINSVNRELDNKRDKMQRIEELGEIEFAKRLGIGFDAAERRRSNLFDEIDMLEKERDNLRQEYNSIKQQTEEGDLYPYEIESALEEPVRDKLMGIGISKGPFVDVKGETTEIIFTKASVSQDDISETRSRLEDMGFQVGEVKGIEV